MNNDIIDRLPSQKTSPTDPAGVVLPPAEEGQFLLHLGKRVRETRERRGMSRKLLARDAAVSERHLAHLEAGVGNISIVLLRRIAMALNVSITELFTDDHEDSVERRLIRRFLERMPHHRLEKVIFRLMRDFGHEEAQRRQKIALIGMRGAGKSTLGKRMAQELKLPFVELVSEIERDVGMPVSEIFSLYGQPGYRRLERRTLDRVLKDYDRAVFSLGGGIVSENDTYEHLLANCYTIWLKATPEDHMARVVSQGDLRPMAGNDEAMDDLRRILESRNSLYGKADQSLDTSNQSIETSFNQLMALVHY